MDSLHSASVEASARPAIPYKVGSLRRLPPKSMQPAPIHCRAAMRDWSALRVISRRARTLYLRLNLTAVTIAIRTATPGSLQPLPTSTPVIVAIRWMDTSLQLSA